MRSFLAYLIFSVLLVICYYEKQYSCPAFRQAHAEPVTNARTFVGNFGATKNRATVSPFQMRLQIDDSFVKGSYRPVNASEDVSLVGAINRENELILIELANGKTTATFKGTMENGQNSLMRLSGTWTSVRSGYLQPFSLNEVR